MRYFLATFLIYYSHLANSAPTFILPKGEAGLPLTTFNLTFRVGSADDPDAQEGLAYMTARLLREGGVKKYGKLPARTRAELEDFLYPLASQIHLRVEKEQSSLTLTTTTENSTRLFQLLVQMLAAPAWNPKEFERIKAETLDFLGKQMPREDQEELGKAALDQVLYGPGHPYTHLVEGRVASLKQLKIEDVKSFYAKYFTANRLIVGLNGVLSPELKKSVETSFGFLPEGTHSRAEIPAAPSVRGRHLSIVTGPFEATGIHLGQAVSFNRSSPDFAPMLIASNAFGKHRTFVGRLMKKVREIRGLNYGTYSYIEDFPNGGALSEPPVQAARSRQVFSIWARPTQPENACFLLRLVTRELDLLATKGLDKAEFDIGKSNLLGSLPVLWASLDRSLGEKIDNSFYGLTGSLLDQIRQQSNKSVKAALTRNLEPKNLHIVVVTKDAKAFQEAVLSKECRIHYAAGVTKPADVLREDKLISTYPLGIDQQNIRILSSETLFQ